MAEWLGNGLQNRVQQFDSAWYLKKKSPAKGLFFLRYQAEKRAKPASPQVPIFIYPSKPPRGGGLVASLRKGGLVAASCRSGGCRFFCIFVCDVEVIVLLNRFWDYD